MVTNYIYLAAIILAGGITTAMALNLWINRKIVETDYSIFLLLSLWLWIIAQIGECMVSPLVVKVIFYKIKVIGISLVSAFMLGFSVQQLRGKNTSLRGLLTLVAAPIVICLVVSFFPPAERLDGKGFSSHPITCFWILSPPLDIQFSISII
jgi:hypothetical protein